MAGYGSTEPVGYLPAQMYQSSAQAEADAEPEYSRRPDISTGSSPPGYPPVLASSRFPAQTAPIRSSAAPKRDFWSGSAASSYPPVPAAPVAYAGGTSGDQHTAPVAFPAQYPAQASSPGRGAPTHASSSSYAPKQDHTVVFMNGEKADRPGYSQPTANITDSPYGRAYSPGRDVRPVSPGVPNGRGMRPSGGTIPAPYDNDRWEQDIRRGFVRKVLLLVAIQLLITTGVSIAFFTVQPIKDYLAENSWPVWVCLFISFAILFTIVCFPATHKFPFDYMLLFGFTVFFSVCIGAITGRYSVQAVGLALAVTCATVFGAFFVAAFTKMDLTKIGGFLTAILFGVIAMSIIGFFWRNKWFHFAIALVSAILFTMFLIYDLQMLMGGRSRQFDPDMYVIAALNIYIDIIQIFLNVLRIIGLVGGGD